MTSPYRDMCAELVEALEIQLELVHQLADMLAARRPKPPSLKEQALAAVAELEGFKGVDTIRRALEALDD